MQTFNMASETKKNVVFSATGGLDTREFPPAGGYTLMQNMSVFDGTFLSPSAGHQVDSHDYTHRGELGDCDRYLFAHNGYLTYGENEYNLGLDNTYPKQIVTIGRKICVFPDKKYLDISDASAPVAGSLEAARTYSATSLAPLTVKPCRSDGTEYGNIVSRDTPPSSPTDGMLWYDTSDASLGLQQYSASTDTWVGISSCYVKIYSEGFTAANLGNFKPGDGVEIICSALPETLRGSFVLQGVSGEDKYIIIPALYCTVLSLTTALFKLKRSLPEMDYVICCRNRLWGCRYGLNITGQGEAQTTTNMIYASCPGDPCNWNVFEGNESDSYAVIVGDEGNFTGGGELDGEPCFFKENKIYRVYGTLPSTYKMYSYDLPGVKAGYACTLKGVRGGLCYLSRNGVTFFTGTSCRNLSEKIAHGATWGTHAAVLHGRYMLPITYGETHSRLYEYDFDTGKWSGGILCNPVSMATIAGQLYYLEKSGIYFFVIRVPIDRTTGSALWTLETTPVVSTVIGSVIPCGIVLSGYAAQSSGINAYIAYDGGSFNMVECQTVEGFFNINIPVNPNKCKFASLKINGSGQVHLYTYGMEYYVREG